MCIIVRHIFFCLFYLTDPCHEGGPKQPDANAVSGAKGTRLFDLMMLKESQGFRDTVWFDCPRWLWAVTTPENAAVFFKPHAPCPVIRLHIFFFVRITHLFCSLSERQLRL